MKKEIGAAILILCAGCASPQKEFNYLGLPEDEDQKVQQQYPEIDSRLHGLTTVTKVQSVDYQEYKRLKKTGKVTEEQRKGDVVYFAVKQMRDVPLPNAGPGDAMGAYFDIVERYKTVVPKDKQDVEQAGGTLRR